jgi:hypothetical protein
MSQPFIFPTVDSVGNDLCVGPINRVTQNIFIGDHNAAANLSILLNNRITHIVNCAKEVPNYFRSHIPIPDTIRLGEPKIWIKFKYLNLGLLDADDSIIPSAEAIFEYITAKLKENPDARFLIHCHMGRSRSASVVIYYLMKTYRCSYDRALTFLKKVRPVVDPNDSYQEQLKLF